MNFNQRMRNIREDNDETQGKTAEILQITRQQYQLYESGKRTIPVDLLKIFCRYYNISADYLLGLIDEPRPIK